MFQTLTYSRTFAKNPILKVRSPGSILRPFRVLGGQIRRGLPSLAGMMALIDNSETQQPPSHHQAANTNERHQNLTSPRRAPASTTGTRESASGSLIQQCLLPWLPFVVSVPANRHDETARPASIHCQSCRVPKRATAEVQILSDIDGLVRSGEMPLVLGRPGSGCTTLLETLAGDIHGFHLDRRDSRLSYEGKNIIPFFQ